MSIDDIGFATAQIHAGQDRGADFGGGGLHGDLRDF